MMIIIVIISFYYFDFDDDNDDDDDDGGLYPTFQHISAGSWRKVREIHQILLSNPRYLASVKNRRRKA